MAHIQSFEMFMTKTDSWSGAQVIQAVKDLNSEIQHFSASLTEWHFSQLQTNGRAITPGLAGQRTATRLGPSLTDFLSTDHRDGADLSVLVQYALQAALCTIVGRNLANFYVGFPAKYDALLTHLYLRMSASEPQAASARWRSLTHRYLSDVFPALEDQALEDFVDDAFRWSADILTLSGTPISQDTLISNGAFRNLFKPQLKLIAQSALRTATAMKEQVLSTNFEVITVEFGKVFERNHMINLFDDYCEGGGKGGGRESVMCTTDLGLRCFSGNGIDERTLVQPTVILESVVDLINASF